MNFLAAEIPDTDSDDDDDYVPPHKSTPNRPPPLSIRKKKLPPFSKTASQAHLDDHPSDRDDDDDGDEDEDDDPEDDDFDDDFDEHEFKQQAALLARTAGPAPTHLRRAATAGPSSSSAPQSWLKQPRYTPAPLIATSSKAAVASSSARGEGSCTVGAGSSSAPAGTLSAPAQGQSPGKSLAVGGGKMDRGVGRNDGAVEGSGREGESGTEKEAQGVRNGGLGKRLEGENKVQSCSTEVIEEHGREGGRGAVKHGIGSGGKNQGDAKKKSEIDDIWAEMNRGSRASGASAKHGKTDDGRTNDVLMQWCGGPPVLQRESKPFKVKLLGELEEEARRKENEEKGRNEEAKRPVKKTGLEAVLTAVKGGKGDGGVLTGTRRAWDDFKKKDEEVEEELEKYKKDKDRYTERVAFLQRTDVREWEYEQAGKRRRR